MKMTKSLFSDPDGWVGEIRRNSASLGVQVTDLLSWPQCTPAWSLLLEDVLAVPGDSSPLGWGSLWGVRVDGPGGRMVAGAVLL